MHIKFLYDNHQPSSCGLHIMYAIVQFGVQMTNTLGTKFSQGAQIFHAWSHSLYEKLCMQLWRVYRLECKWRICKERVFVSCWGIMLGVVHEPHPLNSLSSNTQRTWNKFFVSYPRGSEIPCLETFKRAGTSLCIRIQGYVRGCRGRSSNDECTWNKSYQSWRCS